MGDYKKSRASSAIRSISLNSLKEQIHSLNMQMFLAIQNHDEETQEKLKKQMADVQEEISRISLGGGYRRKP